MNNLMRLATDKTYVTGLRLPTIPSMPQLKKLFPRLTNKTASYIVSHHIRAVTIQNTRSDYPIVIYVDLNNENAIAIFYDKSDTEKRYTIAKPPADLDLSGEFMDTQILLETVSNGLLPNMSDELTNELTSALVDYGYGSDLKVSTNLYMHIVNTEKTAITGRNSIEFLHPRHTEDTVGILKDLFKRYGVKDEIPKDLFHSQDKTWVFRGVSKKQPNSYIEVEVRQAQRSIDKGHEFRVVDPGYKRRIFDVDTVCYN